MIRDTIAMPTDLDHRNGCGDHRQQNLISPVLTFGLFAFHSVKFGKSIAGVYKFLLAKTNLISYATGGETSAVAC
jgi:hypothetical protein